MNLFAAAAADTAANAPDAVSWTALIGVVVSTVCAFIWQVIETRKARLGQRDAAEMMAQTQATAQEIERKVTSNHGHDNIGDKVDRLVDQMAEMTDRNAEVAVRQEETARLLTRTARSLGELRAAFASERSAKLAASAAAEAAEVARLLEVPLDPDVNRP